MKKETISIKKPYDGFVTINFNVAHYNVDEDKLKTMISAITLSGRLQFAQLEYIPFGVVNVFYNPTIVTAEKAQIAIDEIESFIESSAQA